MYGWLRTTQHCGQARSNEEGEIVGLGARKLLGVRRIFARISPNICSKSLPSVYNFFSAKIMKTFFQV